MTMINTPGLVRFTDEQSPKSLPAGTRNATSRTLVTGMYDTLTAIQGLDRAQENDLGQNLPVRFAR
jgi:hypothetical protein